MMESSTSGLPTNISVPGSAEPGGYRQTDLESKIAPDLKALNTLSKAPQDAVTRDAEFNLLVQLNHAFTQHNEDSYAPASDHDLAEMLSLSFMQSPQTNQTTTLMADLLSQLGGDDTSLDADDGTSPLTQNVQHHIGSDQSNLAADTSTLIADLQALKKDARISGH